MLQTFDVLDSHKLGRKAVEFQLVPDAEAVWFMCEHLTSNAIDVEDQCLQISSILFSTC